MRTTVNIADHLLVEAKKLAATRRTSLARIVEDSLRRYLSEYQALERQSRATYALPVMDGGEPLPGVDFNDTSALWEI